MWLVPSGSSAAPSSLGKSAACPGPRESSTVPDGCRGRPECGTDQRRQSSQSSGNTTTGNRGSLKYLAEVTFPVDNTHAVTQNLDRVHTKRNSITNKVNGKSQIHPSSHFTASSVSVTTCPGFPAKNGRCCMTSLGVRRSRTLLSGTANQSGERHTDMLTQDVLGVP